jgi:hypothetical protein
VPDDGDSYGSFWSNDSGNWFMSRTYDTFHDEQMGARCTTGAPGVSKAGQPLDTDALCHDQVPGAQLTRLK